MRFNFFEENKILEMAGINYDKIKVYREAKKRKKMISMENIKDHKKNELHPGFNLKNTNEEFHKQKQRYRSI